MALTPVLRAKGASFLGGTANMVTGDVTHFNRNQSNGAEMNVNTVGNMADNVGGAIAVTDPWSGSSCPPVRHEFPFWQGRVLPMQLEPPARELRLAAAMEVPPQFGTASLREGPEEAAPTSVLSQRACDMKCLVCSSKCGKLPTEHLNPELHLCPECDLPLAG